MSQEALVVVGTFLQPTKSRIVLRGRCGDRSASVEGAVAHRWRDGKLIRYRAYTDPLPAAWRGGEVSEPKDDGVVSVRPK